MCFGGGGRGLKGPAETYTCDLPVEEGRLEVAMPHHPIPQEGQRHLPGKEDATDAGRDGGEGVLDASHHQLLEQRRVPVVRCLARLGRQVAAADDLDGEFDDCRPRLSTFFRW